MPVGRELIHQATGCQRRIGIGELCQRNARTIGVIHCNHRFREEQQAVSGAGGLFVDLVIPQEPRRSLARLSVVKIGTAQQVPALGGAPVSGILFHKKRQLLLRFWIESCIPQAETVGILVIPGVVGLRLHDGLHGS